MSAYYKNNSLKPKPNITQAYTFHQRNKKTKRIIRVIWEGVQIENIEHTKHLCFTKFEHGIKSIRQKANAKKHLIRRLTGA